MSRPLRADARRNREALLTVARDAFAAGEADIRVEEIAKRAGVSVGTLYRHFDTRDAVVEEVYRQEVTEVCDSAQQLLDELEPRAALAAYLRRVVEHAAVSKGMAAALMSIMATDSPVFTGGREQLSDALDLLLERGARTGVIRGDITGQTVLRALGGICGARTYPGWHEEAFRITDLLVDGLTTVTRPVSPDPANPGPGPLPVGTRQESTQDPGTTKGAEHGRHVRQGEGKDPGVHRQQPRQGRAGR